MKKIIGSVLGFASSLAFTGIAFAQTTPINPCPKGNFNNLCTKFTADQTGNIVGTIITFLLIAAVLIALFYLIYGGIRWITSGGDKAKVDEARKHIIAAIVGLIVAFVAYFILQIILSVFGLGSISSLQIPTF